MQNSDLREPLASDPRAETNPRFNVNDPDQWVGAVLLADEIRYYCEVTSPPMISPFDIQNLRPASYDLSLGQEVRIGGRDYRLDAGVPSLLEPHQVAILSTEEVLNVPRFLIARWSIRVRKIYEGMLWTGGLQVDPGWSGPLFCPMYNLSERAIPLYRYDRFFTIDFVRTTSISPALVRMRDEEGLPKVWARPFESEPKLQLYDIYRIHSAPYETLREVEETRQFRHTYAAGLGILFAAIGAVVAALAIFTATVPITPDSSVTRDHPWFALYAAAAVAAFVLAATSCLFTYVIYRKVAIIRTRTMAASGMADRAWEIVTLPGDILGRLIAWPFALGWRFGNWLLAKGKNAWTRWRTSREL